MSWQQDWHGLAQDRARAWEVEVQRQQLLAQVPQRRSLWRRWAGAWLMGVGVWLTRSGAHMAGYEQPQRASVTG